MLGSADFWYNSNMSSEFGKLLIVLGVVIVLVGSWIGQFIQWLDREGLRAAGLKQRLQSAYQTFQTAAASPGQLSAQEISSLYALLTDVKIYLDQKSYAYARRCLELIEAKLEGHFTRTR